MAAENIGLSSRVRGIEPSGIRRIFELMATMEDPINLSIGQAHYDPPEQLIEAACRAMRDGHNRYTVTQGLPQLNDLVLDDVAARLGRRPETCLLTSGVSGGLMLSFLSLLDPGDEILLPDPYFVMYKHLAAICGAEVKFYDTYPKRPGARFGVDLEQIERLVSDKTKIVFVNSPSNPTGGMLTRDEVEGITRIAEKSGAWIVSDEIYDLFCYADEYASPLQFTDRCIQLGGFSKSYGVPGWRMGYATGPSDVLDALKTLQQFSFVCAPAPFQHALVAAMPDIDLTPYRDEYRGKRDLLVEKLHPAFNLSKPEGAFYAFPELPKGKDGAQVPSDAFIEAAVAENVLIVPGKAFSARDTHFRVSFAASDEQLEAGIEVLNGLAERFSA